MFSFLDRTQSSFPVLSATVIDLEDQQYERAKALAKNALANDKDDTEEHQWQLYLTLLGQQAFQSWLSEQGVSKSPRLSEPTFSEPIFSEREPGLAQLGEFRVFLIVVEQCLSEQVNLPVSDIDDPNKAAHFYMLLEVAEEQSEVWLRGLLRRDHLCQLRQTQAVADNSATITLPLSAFEPEPSRLLHYCRHLEPSAIPLPQAPSPISQVASLSDTVAATISATVATVRTRLSDWLETSATQSSPTDWQPDWQPWNLLQPQLAYATRGLSDGLKRGKLVNLGVTVGSTTVALVLTLMPEADEKINTEKINIKKINILVQLLPTGGDRTLPPQVTLALVSKKGKSLQTVTSRNQDNYIQLKSFKGTAGQRFSLQIQHQDVTVSEDFEI